jgi:hypothetical protein
MPDLKPLIGIVGFLLILGLLLSYGIAEVIEETFDSIQPDNPSYSTPFTSKTISFLVVTLIALSAALRLIGMK